jgi:hypothetical protein
LKEGKPERSDMSTRIKIQAPDKDVFAALLALLPEKNIKVRNSKRFYVSLESRDVSEEMKTKVETLGCIVSEDQQDSFD